MPRFTPLKARNQGSIANRSSRKHLIFPNSGILTKFQCGVTKGPTRNYSRGGILSPPLNKGQTHHFVGQRHKARILSGRTVYQPSARLGLYIKSRSVLESSRSLQVLPVGASKFQPFYWPSPLLNPYKNVEDAFQIRGIDKRLGGHLMTPTISVRHTIAG